VPLLSVVLPCHNEEPVLASTLEELERYLTRRGVPFEILVSDDSSTDATARVAEEFAARSPAVRLVPRAAERGKGAALTRGFRAARGLRAAFLDADLEIPVENLELLLAALDEGADVAIGSKLLGAAAAKRPLLRRLLTRGFSSWVRLWLASGLSDHQAGIKAFRLERCRPALARVRAHGWIWDTELLVYAQQAGLAIREVPITTRQVDRPSRLSVLRDALRMARDVVALRLRGVRVR
jgi:glycosyltransferase involved in cell wall biosynthesis